MCPGCGSNLPVLCCVPSPSSIPSIFPFHGLPTSGLLFLLAPLPKALGLCLSSRSTLLCRSLQMTLNSSPLREATASPYGIFPATGPHDTAEPVHFAHCPTNTSLKNEDLRAPVFKISSSHIPVLHGSPFHRPLSSALNFIISSSSNSPLLLSTILTRVVL